MESDARSDGRNLLAAAVVGATATVAGRRIVARLTRGRFGDAEEYNVGKVAVSGPITRKSGRPSPLSGPGGTTADDVVEQIEAADEDEDVEALVVELNTPGGEVLPSDDIRRAAADFDGPTVAYATDTCASGGYWIASGCDELWARDASLVGSIGVVGSRPNAAGLADKLGIPTSSSPPASTRTRASRCGRSRRTNASTSRGSSTATTSSSSRRSARAETWTRRRSGRPKRGSTSAATPPRSGSSTSSAPKPTWKTGSKR
jgi:hypothetical protein